MSKVYYEDWFAVDPLTPKEQRWIESLQRVLARCPDSGGCDTCAFSYTATQVYIDGWSL